MGDDFGDYGECTACHGNCDKWDDIDEWTACRTGMNMIVIIYLFIYISLYVFTFLYWKAMS